jgi:guanylate kinase
MRTAEAELARREEYQAVIVNDDLEAATAALVGLIRDRYPGWLPE